MKMQNLKQIFKKTALAVIISSSMQTFAAVNDQVIAIVGQSAILQSDLEQAIAETELQLQAQKKEAPPRNILEAQILNQLIMQQAQLEQVKRFAIQADEKSLNEAVMKVAAQSGSTSLESFQQKLDNIAPGTYETLRERVADDLLIQRLRQQQVTSRIKISDQDVNNFLKSPEGQAALGGQAHVIHFRIAGTSNQEEITKVAEQIKADLNNNIDVKALENKYTSASITVNGADMGFRDFANIPTELAARVATLDIGQTTEIIAAKDGLHVLKLVNRKASDQKAIVPQFQTRHILIKSSEIVSPENAKQMIDSIYDRILAGEDFTTLASTYSNDPGSARDGGSLGWVSPGMMVPEFDKIMQSSEVNKVSQPFETQFGWHILQVTDQRQQDMTKEMQTRMARQILGERQFDAELDSWLRELRNNTYVEIKGANAN